MSSFLTHNPGRSLFTNGARAHVISEVMFMAVALVLGARLWTGSAIASFSSAGRSKNQATE